MDREFERKLQEVFVSIQLEKVRKWSPSPFYYSLPPSPNSSCNQKVLLSNSPLFTHVIQKLVRNAHMGWVGKECDVLVYVQVRSDLIWQLTKCWNQQLLANVPKRDFAWLTRNTCHKSATMAKRSWKCYAARHKKEDKLSEEWIFKRYIVSSIEGGVNLWWKLTSLGFWKHRRKSGPT